MKRQPASELRLGCYPVPLGRGGCQQQRLDKGYSLTDCASMIVMKEQRLWEIMTYDRYFAQEGFNPLLREN
ncbi:MAG: hypothetical protein MGG11_08475 [Trichodesmium sp. MAG_R03]|nr:hypothetical protein [Trichodesmium sp. MAG_R03]